MPGVEDVAPYRRSLRLAHGAGVATLSPAAGGMRVELDLDDPRDEDEALAQLSALLDLDAPAEEIAEVLGRDPVLGFTPGLRVPGGDGDEIAVRAVLTQQISVRAACTHAARLVAPRASRSRGRGARSRTCSRRPRRSPPRPTASSRCPPAAARRCARWPASRSTT